MTVSKKTQSDAVNPQRSRDTTGRSRLVHNVLSSWLAQLVFIAAGFIMPRLIDQHLGQSLLGIWDFSWSLVGYFTLVQVGIVASISRYVAMSQAKGDQEGINRAVSSVTCVLFVMAVVIALLTVGGVALMGQLKGDELGDHLPDARWVVLLLGFEMAVNTAFSGFGGVLTGCHRWGIHNGIHAVSYIGVVIGMIVALLTGCGLRTMAAIHLTGAIVGWGTRYFVSYRICPGLSVRPRLANLATAMSMLNFGGKSFVPQIGDLILNQTLNVLVAAYLGPASLAVFARSRSLIRYAREMVMKLAAVLVPSVSSLHAAGQHENIQGLVIKATRYAAFLTFPITALLVISGNPLLHLWMGPRYADSWVLPVLAIGHMGFILQVPVTAILAGMNMHGRVAIANLIGSIAAALGVTWVLAYLKLGLLAVAVAASWPLILIHTVYVPLQTCARTGVSFGRYVKEAIGFPLLCILPFAVCLLAGRIMFAENPIVALFGGGIAGGLLLVPIYWIHVLPASLKAGIRKRFFRNSLGSMNGAVVPAASARNTTPKTDLV